MNTTIKQVLKFSVFTTISVVLLYIVFKDINLPKLWTDIKSANYFYIGLSVTIALLGFVSRAARWNLLIEPLGYKPSLKNNFFSVMFGYFVNLLIPRGGEVARCTALANTEKIPFDNLVGTVILERAFDFLILCLLGVASVLLKFDVFYPFVDSHVLQPIVMKFQNVNWLLVVSILIAVGVGCFFILNKFGFWGKVKAFLQGIAQGVISVFKMKKRLLFILHTIIIWAVYWITTYIVFLSIPPTSNLDLVDALFILVIGGIGMTVPVQSGMGVYHSIIAFALTIFGLDMNTEGKLFAVLAHESQVLLIILFGFISMFFIVKQKSKKNEYTS